MSVRVLSLAQPKQQVMPPDSRRKRGWLPKPKASRLRVLCPGPSFARTQLHTPLLMTIAGGHSGMAKEALQKLRIGLRHWPKNGYLSLLTANLEAKMGHVGPARRLYAVAAAHSLRSTIALQVEKGIK